MTVFVVLLILFLLYLVQAFLYDRLWNRGLSAGVAFREEYRTEEETSTPTEVIVNDKLLPMPVVEIDFHMDKRIQFSDGQNSSVSDRSYRRDVCLVRAAENHPYSGVLNVCAGGISVLTRQASTPQIFF